MPKKNLHLSHFGGGVALLGSSDIQRTDELQVCDSYEIGDRGQLVVASDVTGFANALDAAGVPVRMYPLYGCAPTGIPPARALMVAGIGSNAANPALSINRLDLVTLVGVFRWFTTALLANGYVMTFASFPFVDRLGVQQRPLIVNFGAREGTPPRQGYSVLPIQDTGVGTNVLNTDWLGTGAGQLNEAVAGTKSKLLFARGVAGYNGHLMLWGFDNKDATDGEGSNRLMFSNTGNPTKIGNDPGPAGVDRDFLDTDAINIGAAGEIIRAGYSWAGKFWIGTNRELHYLAGFGRESFLTNGTVGIRRSRNVIGPNCMLEGPDGLLYGVSSEGLWGFDGASVEPLYRRVVDFRSKSLGWWDLIWQDATRAVTYPGRTNQDLVWMMADPDTMQVWVVIPWCNAAAGYGYGLDTVIVKYHTDTGGFSRQVFTGKILAHGSLIKRESSLPSRRYILDSQQASNNVKVYGAKADASVSPVMPSALPLVTFGEYAPFGPDGSGVTRKIYLTISWDSAASLPIVFSATPYVDQQPLTPAIKVSVQPAVPVAPADGDLWLDTSSTDTNLGNSVAGNLVLAAGDYVLKRWMSAWNKWVTVPAGGGELGTRATIPIAFRAYPAARVKLAVSTVSAVGRYQIEGLGLEPAGAA